MSPTPTAYRAAVAAEVRAHMGRTRTSQTALAKVLGMSQSAMSRRLNGETAFDMDDVCKLAQHFDVRLSALLPEPVAAKSNVIDLRDQRLLWTPRARLAAERKRAS